MFGIKGDYLHPYGSAYGVRGKGIASKIAKVAVEYAKAQARIRPLCPYMSAYIKRHPEYHSITVDMKTNPLRQNKGGSG